MKPITVLIVDDSALIRRMFHDFLHDVQGISVVGTAVDAQDAREKIKRLNPDVLTLDIEMPGMDGLAFLEKIMALRPMPVVMVSTLTQKGASATIRALELGAVDYLSKPLGTQTSNTLELLREELITKVRTAADANLTQRRITPASQKVLSFNPPLQPKLIAIGSSTGGVEALREIFARLPENCPPIVMVQHMPKAFTPSFAARLDGVSKVHVAEAFDGAKLQSGHAWLAPGDAHLSIVKKAGGYECRLQDGPTVSGHRPSVDVLFDSVASEAGAQAVGVILTGMGKDGAQGMLRMRQAGAYTLGQNEQSCVVYGMPRAAKAIDAVCSEHALSDIADVMLRHCEEAVHA